MVRADSYSIKPLKEIDEDPVCSDCSKRCDFCKNFLDHISSFKYFATKKNQNTSHMHHTKYDLFSILNKMWQTRCWIN